MSDYKAGIFQINITDNLEEYTTLPSQQSLCIFKLLEKALSEGFIQIDGAQLLVMFKG